MSTIEGYPQLAEYEPFEPDFAADAATLGVFRSPDVKRWHETVISTKFPTEVAYQQALVPLLWACNSHYLDEHTQDRQAALRGTAFCLTDVHYQSGHYEYCLGELKFIEQNLVRTDNESLLPYIHEMITHVSSFINSDHPLLDSSPVRTEIIC
jgi:hypothetical protein